MADQQNAGLFRMSHQEPEGCSRSGFTAINRPRTVEDVQSVHIYLLHNVKDGQESCELKPVSDKKPGAKARKRLILQSRRDGSSRISKSNHQSTKGIRASQRLGKESITSYANTLKSHTAINELNDHPLSLPSEEETIAQPKKAAASTTKAGPTTQRTPLQQQDEVTRQERGLVGGKEAVATWKAVPMKWGRGQQRIKILPEHVAEVTRRSNAAARSRAAAARAIVEQQQRSESQSRARYQRGIADHVAVEKGESRGNQWMGIPDRRNMYVLP